MNQVRSEEFTPPHQNTTDKRKLILQSSSNFAPASVMSNRAHSLISDIFRTTIVMGTKLRFSVTRILWTQFRLWMSKCLVSVRPNSWPAISSYIHISNYVKNWTVLSIRFELNLSVTVDVLLRYWSGVGTNQDPHHLNRGGVIRWEALSISSNLPSSAMICSSIRSVSDFTSQTLRSSTLPMTMILVQNRISRPISLWE